VADREVGVAKVKEAPPLATPTSLSDAFPAAAAAAVSA